MKRAPRLCFCGHTVAFGYRCPCQRDRALRAKDQRASARDRGYDREWDKLAAEHRRAHPRCVECGAPVGAVDHIIPVSERPDLRLEPSNLQSLCRSHHAQKTAAETKAKAGGRLRFGKGIGTTLVSSIQNSPEKMVGRNGGQDFWGVV